MSRKALRQRLGEGAYTNDHDQQAGTDGARAARRAEALEEEARLREEEEVDDAELATIFARAGQLKP